MYKNLSKVSKLFLVCFIALAAMGCKGGGGSGGGASSGQVLNLAGNDNGGSGTLLLMNADESVSSGSSGSDSGTSTPLGRTHNPEPSSLLLLGSGLVSMAVYAKAKLKSKIRK